MANPETRERELKWACDFVGGSLILSPARWLRAHPPGASSICLSRRIPYCLQEQPKAQGEVVGRFEFREDWLLTVPDDFAGKLDAVDSCAVDIAKSLREAVQSIRLNNQPAK